MKILKDLKLLCAKMSLHAKVMLCFSDTYPIWLPCQFFYSIKKNLVDVFSYEELILIIVKLSFYPSIP